eukprot:CAMPEP_0171639186 /NCGR_PEP_ID=MMETSP0990-20121206/29532_1 /TAXON_ID=483369 /ORGANISM="non described non described, Strain CCMP2098" /LENGTH=54 /DNA_ID=CAMNT_0012212813 /DNA_START=59 /DNA_END=219 /DNA_ORIENTATION=+
MTPLILPHNQFGTAPSIDTGLHDLRHKIPIRAAFVRFYLHFILTILDGDLTTFR